MTARLKNLRDVVTDIRQSFSPQSRPASINSVESAKELQEPPPPLPRPNYSTWKYPSKKHNLSEYPPPYNSQTNTMTNLLPKVLARRRKEFVRSTMSVPRAHNHAPRAPPRVELTREINNVKKPKKYVIMQTEKEHYSFTARLDALQPNRMRECVQAMDFKTPK